MFYLRQYINVNMKKMGIVASCVWIGGTVLKDKNSHEAVGEIQHPGIRMSVQCTLNSTVS